MDIDAPPSIHDEHAGHNHLTLPPFSAAFPLPFRVLFLIGLAQLLWAVNLHVFHLLGLDTSWILNLYDADEGEGAESSGMGGVVDLDEHSAHEVDSVTLTRGRPTVSTASRGRPESGKLFQPVYKLCVLYSAWVGGGWAVFRLVTGARPEAMERYRGLVAVVALGPVLGALIPWRGVGERERTALRR